jgi:hypothetical protein
MPAFIRRRRAAEPVEITNGLLTSTTSLLGTFGGQVVITDGLIVSTSSLQGVVGVPVLITNGLITSTSALLGSFPSVATPPAIPGISPPPLRDAMLDNRGLVTPAWARFYTDVYNLLK